MLSGLLELFKQELLCDVSITSGDGVEIPAHRVVLAASSQYFKALLTGPWSTALHGQRSLKLDQFTGDALRTAVQVPTKTFACRGRTAYPSLLADRYTLFAGTLFQQRADLAPLMACLQRS